MKKIAQETYNFFLKVIYWTMFYAIFLTLITLFVLGFVYLMEQLSDTDYTETIISVLYSILWVLGVYYLFGIKRINTKSLAKMLRQDFYKIKKFTKEFPTLLKTFLSELFGISVDIIKLLAMLLGSLMLIILTILAFVSFGWMIASLSATTVIIILLIMILLK